jgi:hypothetical protein
MTGREFIERFSSLMVLMISQETNPRSLRDTLSFANLLEPRDKRATLEALSVCTLAKNDSGFAQEVSLALMEDSAPWN